jgi:hypothetical protein
MILREVIDAEANKHLDNGDFRRYNIYKYCFVLILDKVILVDAVVACALTIWIMLEDVI